jgi:hypothetical protein
LNGDSKIDLFIGAQGNAGGGASSGAAYTVWGRSPLGASPIPWQTNVNGPANTPAAGVTGVIDVNTIQ